MGFGSRALLAGGLGFAAAFAVACGSSNGLLSSGQSSTLAGDLNSISSALASGQCAKAQQAAAALNNHVASLPQTVTSTLLQNLGQGAGTVSQLASRDCHPRSSSTSASSSSSTPSSTTSSIPTTTTTTTTTITPTATSTSTAPAGGGTATGGSGGTSSNGGAGIGGTATGAG